MAAEKPCDVVIVGGGVAGTSCALECLDIRLDTVVYESNAAVGGQIAQIPHSVRNVLAWRFEAGVPVRRAVEESVAILGDRLRVSERVIRVDLAEHWVEVGATRVHARAIVLATGTRRQELPAAPDGAFGGDVTYLVESRPEHFAGRDVVVVGGGDSATLDALELAAAIEQNPSATPTTETPAMVFDRLSVLTIRVHFTEGAGDRFAARLPVLRFQVALIQEALEGLFDDVRAGRKRFVPYESLKLYGSGE